MLNLKIALQPWQEVIIPDSVHALNDEQLREFKLELNEYTTGAIKYIAYANPDMMFVDMRSDLLYVIQDRFGVEDQNLDEWMNGSQDWITEYIEQKAGNAIVTLS